MQSKQYCPYTIFCDRADYHEGAVENEFCNQAPMQDTGLSHPALVIAVMQRPQSLVVGDLLCKIVPVSCTLPCLLNHLTSMRKVHTWRKTSLRVYWQLRQTLRKFRDTIPIYKDSAENSEAYESRGYPFLHLDGGHLRYQSYINFNHTYTVPISYLRAYSRIHARSAFDIMLGRASYYKLMGWLGLSPQPYLTQWELVATGMERLRAMAAAQSAYGGMFQAPAVNYGTWTEPSEETRAALAKRDRSMALTYHEAVAVQEYDNLYANQPYGGY